MVSRGHSLQALLHDYPIDLVLNLHRAAMENQKAELIGRVMGFSIAVSGSLDSVFNSGKSKVLKNWLKAMDSPQGGQEEAPKREAKAKRSTLSPATVAFLSGLPTKSKKG